MYSSMTPSKHIECATDSEYNNEVEYKLYLGQPNLKGTVFVIFDDYETEYACGRIKEYCSQCKVVGFDAEWTPTFVKSAARNKVALLQIATPMNGDVFLFQLNMLFCIPPCLKTILEDKNIIKVGVNSFLDSSYLKEDFNVNVRSVVDLRLLYNTMKGLAGLAKEVLNVTVSKGFARISNWEKEFLSQEQVLYAATDAYASVEIFKKWAGIKIGDHGHPNIAWDQVLPKIYKYLDVPFKKLDQIIPHVPNLRSNVPESLESPSPQRKPIYNSIVNGPDNTFLWNVSKSDAEVLVRQGKGEIVGYTIRLFPEIQDPSVGDLDLERLSTIPFPKIEKVRKSGAASLPDFTALNIKTTKSCANTKVQCVVCGIGEKLVKKHIVPKSYISLCPSELDGGNVLQLCVFCERKTQGYTQKLSDHFRFTTGGILSPSVQKSLNYMRVFNVHDYSSVLLKFLRDSQDWKKDYSLVYGRSLGEAVVLLFKKNNQPLSKLIKLWRDMFVEDMQPQFLPNGWL